MRLVPWVVIGLTGCAQLFGIAETTSGDGSANNLGLTVERVSIGSSVVKTPLDLSAQTATYLVADATDPSGYRRVPATLTGADMSTWTAMIPDGTPAIELTLPDYPTPIKRLVALPNRNLAVSFTSLENPTPRPAPAGATLALTVTLPSVYAATETFQIYSIGSWVSHNLAAELPAVGGGAIGPATIPYDAAHFSSSSGRPLEAITMDDSFLVLRYVGNDLTGVFEALKFDQTGTDTVMGTMTGNTESAMLDVTVMPTEPGMRIGLVRPATTALVMGWQLAAAPGYASGIMNGPQLQAGGVAPTDTGHITVPYGNPFIAHGWNTALHWNTYASRTYTDPATMLPVTLYAGLDQIVEPTSGLSLDLPSGLPVSILINQGLLADGTTITLDPTKSVAVSATLDKTMCTFYQFAVEELVPNAMMAPTALVPATRYQVTAVTQQIDIPPGVFESTKLYTVRATCVLGGFPTFMDGNLENRTLPVSQGYLDSGVFKVM